MYIFYTTAKGRNMNYRIKLRVFHSYIRPRSSFTRGVASRNITIHAISLETKADLRNESYLKTDVTRMLDRLDQTISPTLLVLDNRGTTAQIMLRDSCESSDGKYLTGLWLDATDTERTLVGAAERRLDAKKRKFAQEIVRTFDSQQLPLPLV